MTNAVVYLSPELEQLRELVAGARAQLAGLATDYTKEKSRVEAVHAALFRSLREHYRKRDRLRLAVEYRKKCLDLLIRDCAEEAKQEQRNYERAKTQLDTDYEEIAAAVDAKKELNAEQEAELTGLWKKLVKLYHPDRFAQEPEKLETYHKLTSAINRAKDAGDINALRDIAEDPHGFMLRKGWATLDFSEATELTQLRRLYQTLQTEVITVRESLNQLRASPDYELCQITEQEPAMLDELTGVRKKALEKESAELEKKASKLADEIKKLDGKAFIGG